jgi:hypothetical protein
MLNPSLVGSKIQYDLPAVTQKQIEQFKKAIFCDGGHKLPLAFWTSYRKAEFEWLDKLHVKINELLHTEQEYHFLKPFNIGEPLRLCTAYESERTRKTQKGIMIFVTLTTDIIQNNEVCVGSKTVFIIRREK